MKHIRLTLTAAVLAVSAVAAHAAPPSKGGGDGGGSSIYQSSAYSTFNDNQGTSDLYFDFVPAGKRLIIETVTYRTSLPQDSQTASCEVTQGNQLLAILPQAQRSGVNMRDGFESSAHIATTIYAEEGTVTIRCTRSSTTWQGGLYGTIAGTLVDAK